MTCVMHTKRIVTNRNWLFHGLNTTSFSKIFCLLMTYQHQQDNQKILLENQIDLEASDLATWLTEPFFVWQILGVTKIPPNLNSTLVFLIENPESEHNWISCRRSKHFRMQFVWKWYKHKEKIWRQVIKHIFLLTHTPGVKYDYLIIKNT